MRSPKSLATPRQALDEALKIAERNVEYYAGQGVESWCPSPTDWIIMVEALKQYDYVLKVHPTTTIIRGGGKYAPRKAGK